MLSAPVADSQFSVLSVEEEGLLIIVVLTGRTLSFLFKYASTRSKRTLCRLQTDEEEAVEEDGWRGGS